jgi:hypothetical protein
MLSWLKAKVTYLWSHRTKALGAAALGAGAIQNYQAQVGIFIPAKYAGSLTMVFGALAIFVGLYNTFKPREPSAN